MPFQRIPIVGADTPHVAAAAEAIRARRRVVLPTETVYGLAADPRDAASVALVQNAKGRAADAPFTHHLASRASLEALAASPPRRVERLLERFWPGPLTVILPGRDGGSVGLRVPAQPFTRAVIAAVGPSLYLTSVDRSGEPLLAGPDEIAAEFASEVDLLFDAGAPQLRMPSTVVRCTGSQLEVLREGILTAREVQRAAAQLILFVCSGNTCRSPMAEALARSMAAKALGVGEHELLARGLDFASAGTGTLPGLPPSDGALAAMATIGFDLSGHQSRSLSRHLARQAERILCMGQGHRQRVLDMDPGLAPKVELLDPDGHDVQDPFGGSTEGYVRARDAIRAALQRRLPELIAGV